jgi:hypothetical protein
MAIDEPALCSLLHFGVKGYPVEFYGTGRAPRLRAVSRSGRDFYEV